MIFYQMNLQRRRFSYSYKEPEMGFQHSYIKQIKTEAHQIDFMDKLELKSYSVKQDVHDCVYL